MKRVEIVSRRTLLCDFFAVEEVLVRHERPDGTLSPPLRRLCVERGDGVAAVLVRPEAQTVILVRQFRYAAHARGPGWLLEAVAGMVAPGEEPEAAARREILEETGYHVRRLEPVATFYLSPGGSSERIFLYHAEAAGGRAASGGGLAEEHEDIEVVEVSLSQAWQLLDQGAIADAKTLVGLLWLRHRLAAT
ncbi:MAG: NUDIX hydrolase [Candidatus Latescibacterota bacterium]